MFLELVQQDRDADGVQAHREYVCVIINSRIEAGGNPNELRALVCVYALRLTCFNIYNRGMLLFYRKESLEAHPFHDVHHIDEPRSLHQR